MNETINKVMEAIRTQYEELEVVQHTVSKNNGVIQQGIVLREKGVSIAPVIYLSDEILEMELQEIVDYVMDIYKKNQTIPKIADFVDKIQDFEQIKPYLRLMLVNKERNTDILEVIPHVKFIDFAVLVYIDFGMDEDGFAGTVKVKQEILDIWCKSFDEIYEIAHENTLKDLEIVHGDDIFRLPDSTKMLILTNKSRYYGAICLIFQSIMREASEILQDDLVIIPSSIHDLIAFPYSCCGDLEDLKSIIRNVNNQMVEEIDILGDYPFVYNRATDCYNWGDSVEYNLHKICMDEEDLSDE